MSKPFGAAWAIALSLDSALGSALHACSAMQHPRFQVAFDALPHAQTSAGMPGLCRSLKLAHLTCVQIPPRGARRCARRESGTGGPRGVIKAQTRQRG